MKAFTQKVKEQGNCRRRGSILCKTVLWLVLVQGAMVAETLQSSFANQTKSHNKLALNWNAKAITIKYLISEVLDLN